MNLTSAEATSLVLAAIAIMLIVIGWIKGRPDKGTKETWWRQK
jgi:hypothetical protein